MNSFFNCIHLWLDKNKKRRATIRCLFSIPGYRQVTIQHKQARTVHALYGREPSELLALMLWILAVFWIERDKSRKLKLSKKYERECDAQFYWFVIIIVCSLVPWECGTWCGSMAPECSLVLSVSCYCCFSFTSYFVFSCLSCWRVQR